jgi:uncharacterized protein
MVSTGPKLEKMRSIIRSADSAAVAFSGGSDSTLVAKIAKDELGERAVALTIDTPLFPRGELKGARAVAKMVGIRHIIVGSDILDDPSFNRNPRDRCYICKLAGFKEARRVADSLSLRHVLDGSNSDDERAYRPGSRAKSELGVRSPLAEAGLSKEDVAKISKRLRLPTHGKDPSPCLATRVPYGDKLTVELLARVEKAEQHLAKRGFRQVRVRAHGGTARIEVSKDQVRRLLQPQVRDETVRRLKSLGFAYVTVDLEGYRSGSMDEVLGR